MLIPRSRIKQRVYISYLFHIHQHRFPSKYDGGCQSNGGEETKVSLLNIAFEVSLSVRADADGKGDVFFFLP